MPMITVRYVTTDMSTDVRSQIAERVARLSSDHLGKDPRVTAVLVEPADPLSWFVSGRNPTQDGLSAFWLDIKITSGTNVKGETERFVEAVYEAMRELLGPLHEECDVLVHAVDGDAYGYGGRTQNARWAEARAKS